MRVPNALASSTVVDHPSNSDGLMRASAGGVEAEDIFVRHQTEMPEMPGDAGALSLRHQPRVEAGIALVVGPAGHHDGRHCGKAVRAGDMLQRFHHNGMILVRPELVRQIEEALRQAVTRLDFGGAAQMVGRVEIDGKAHDCRLASAMPDKNAGNRARHPGSTA